jgi:hypothetical protein
MKHKVISLTVVILASSIAGLILFTKKTEQTFAAPAPEIPQEAIEKAPSPDEVKAVAPTATNEVAKAIADDLLNRNPKGPQPSERQPGVLSVSAMDPNIIAGNILEDQAKKITTEVFSGGITSADIHSSSSASSQDYLLARGKIIVNAQASLQKYEKKKFDDSTLGAMKSAAEHATAELKKLTVPKELIDIHTEQLRLLGAQIIIYGNILNRDSDPIAAAISIELLKRVDAELATLSDKIKVFIEQHAS